MKGTVVKYNKYMRVTLVSKYGSELKLILIIFVWRKVKNIK